MSLQACGPSHRPDLLIEDVWIVDVNGGSPQRANVCIDAGRIQRIFQIGSPGCPAATQTIAGEGGYLIPGLWDVHVHLAEDGLHEDALATLVTHGVTTVRDMGGRFDVLATWREQITAAERIGPDLLLVGPTVNGPGDDSYHLEASTYQEGAAAADSLAELGVEQVKVHRLLPRDAFRGILEAANRNGLAVVGHIPWGVDALEACESGMAEVAHLSALLEAAVMRDENPASGISEAVNELTGQRGEAAYRCLGARGGAVTPNLVAYAHLARVADSASAAATWRLIDELGRTLEPMAEAGVILMVGSDAPGEDDEIPWGISVHEELELLVRAGMDPLDALAAATIGPARFMGSAHEVGSIEAGKRADLLLLRTNPLEEIGATRDIKWVILNGRPIDPHVTNSLLPSLPAPSRIRASPPGEELTGTPYGNRTLSETAPRRGKTSSSSS